MNLTTTDLQDLETSRAVLRHVIDAEPANRKLGGWEIAAWVIEELSPKLIVNGKFRHPKFWDAFWYVGFAIRLLRKINESMKDRNKAKTITH